MNDRIKSLIEKATVKESSHGAFGEPEIWKRLDEELLVKLVATECAGIYDKIDNGNEHLGTNNYCKAIAKHFGIK
jgi:hypothetical protein